MASAIRTGKDGKERREPSTEESRDSDCAESAPSPTQGPRQRHTAIARPGSLVSTQFLDVLNVRVAVESFGGRLTVATAAGRNQSSKAQFLALFGSCRFRVTRFEGHGQQLEIGLATSKTLRENYVRHLGNSSSTSRKLIPVTDADEDIVPRKAGTWSCLAIRAARRRKETGTRSVLIDDTSLYTSYSLTMATARPRSAVLRSSANPGSRELNYDSRGSERSTTSSSSDSADSSSCALLAPERIDCSCDVTIWLYVRNARTNHVFRYPIAVRWTSALQYRLTADSPPSSLRPICDRSLRPPPVVADHDDDSSNRQFILVTSDPGKLRIMQSPPPPPIATLFFPNTSPITTDSSPARRRYPRSAHLPGKVIQIVGLAKDCVPCPSRSKEDDPIS